MSDAFNLPGLSSPSPIPWCLPPLPAHSYQSFVHMLPQRSDSLTRQQTPRRRERCNKFLHLQPVVFCIFCWLQPAGQWVTKAHLWAIPNPFPAEHVLNGAAKLQWTRDPEQRQNFYTLTSRKWLFGAKGFLKDPTQNHRPKKKISQKEYLETFHK